MPLILCDVRQASSDIIGPLIDSSVALLLLKSGLHFTYTSTFLIHLCAIIFGFYFLLLLLRRAVDCWRVFQRPACRG